MSNYKYKEIKEIIEFTPKELDSKQITDFKYCPVGYYQSAGTNWVYKVYVIEYKGFLREVVTIFGSIVARR